MHKNKIRNTTHITNLIHANCDICVKLIILTLGRSANPASPTGKQAYCRCQHAVKLHKTKIRVVPIAGLETWFLLLRFRGSPSRHRILNGELVRPVVKVLKFSKTHVVAIEYPQCINAGSKKDSNPSLLSYRVCHTTNQLLIQKRQL
jgi:hypothetical protein